MSKKYFKFSLIGINIESIDKKYCIDSVISNSEKNDSDYLNNPNNFPKNITKIDDLEISKKKPDSISFLDEIKKNRKCTISMIDFSSNRDISEINIKYKCFWHKDFIPPNISPIGCPIKFISNKATKIYYSEISRELYSITENVTEKVSQILNLDDRITIDKKSYYLTDGIFCSFNCCLAFIESPEIRTNPLYRHSSTLLHKLYFDIHDKNFTDIIPAPHWRLLQEFGGNLSIDKFTECFNKIKFIDHGNYFVSLGRLYEDQLKF